jgi:hypothetical protein
MAFSQVFPGCMYVLVLWSPLAVHISVVIVCRADIGPAYQQVGEGLSCAPPSGHYVARQWLFNLTEHRDFFYLYNFYSMKNAVLNVK